MLGCLHSWMWIRWKLNFSDMLQWIVISNLCVLQPKLEKQGIYGHAFLTLVIIPQCHSFVILVIKPPFYLPNSSPVEHISMHAYSIGWHLSCYHPPMHAYSLGWHLSCYHLPSQPRLLPYFPLVPVNLLHVSLITHICGIFARITVTLKKIVGYKWNCYVQEYFVLFGRWFRECWYRYICNSKNSRERSKMWIVILAADKYFLPPCFISSFELFCFGRKKL
jgi:hypothetical protein